MWKWARIPLLFHVELFAGFGVVFGAKYLLGEGAAPYVLALAIAVFFFVLWRTSRKLYELKLSLGEDWQMPVLGVIAFCVVPSYLIAALLPK